MWTESEEAVRKTFYKHASRRYSGTISDMKKKWQTKQIKPKHVGDEVWNEWTKAWDVEEYKNRCEQNRKNRLSERVTGVGPSTHTGGSRSMTQLKKNLTEKEGREPTAPELFLYTHTKDHDGVTFIDQRSAHAYARFQAMVSSIRATASLSVDGESSSPTLPIDENMIWLEAEGSKQRVYGIGSSTSSFYSSRSSSSSATTSPNADYIHVLQKPLESHRLLQHQFQFAMDYLREHGLQVMSYLM
ncbi:uncharacterized protein LOC126670329 [Mercurialis annua]|uniref:uncharacterized protein LOC126670329 n=1 Tax=Mercurialis annua TaxID=3986 RepID=UPI00216062D6|nr:uncharacterized protein LOC126670329 [Mercurialis annua]